MPLSNSSNQDYHADRNYISSSGLKLLLKDQQAFYKRYILNEPEEIKNSAALNFGTAAHLAILEPHLYAESIKIFKGLRRSGAVWDIFASDHRDKIILNSAEEEKLLTLVEIYKQCSAAVELLKDCEFESTKTKTIDGIALKVRADAVNHKAGYVVDLKTTGFSADRSTFKLTCDSLCYDLSAYMYAKIFSSTIDYDFYFIVLSKSDMNCKVYKASKSMMLEGKTKFYSAIETLKNNKLTGIWENVIINEETTTTINNEIEDI